jgi:hypothetical protein
MVDSPRYLEALMRRATLRPFDANTLVSLNRYCRGKKGTHCFVLDGFLLVSCELMPCRRVFPEVALERDEAELDSGTVFEHLVDPLRGESVRALGQDDVRVPCSLHYRATTVDRPRTPHQYRARGRRARKRTEKHNRMTCVSAYDSERSRSKSSCPTRSVSCEYQGGGQERGRTSRVPETQLDINPINVCRLLVSSQPLAHGSRKTTNPGRRRDSRTLWARTPALPHLDQLAVSLCFVERGD